MRQIGVPLLSVAVLTLIASVGCKTGDSDAPSPDTLIADADPVGVEEPPENAEPTESERLEHARPTESVTPPKSAQPNESEPASPSDSEWSNSIGMRFRIVPAGNLELEAPRQGSLDQASIREQFTRQAQGDPPLPPAVRRPVRITRRFSISTCDVSNAEFRKMRRRVIGRPLERDRPAGVSWDEATEFCRWLSELPDEIKAGRRYRLPTQAEWQLAEPRQVECYPWHRTVEHVSVWNWCVDFFDPEYYRALPDDMPTLDPRGAESGSSHVVMCTYSHPDPFWHLTTFRVVAESGFPGDSVPQ